jgi:hypothetical protein
VLAALCAFATAERAAAQCSPSRAFASVGLTKTQVQVDVDVSGAQNAGQEIGRFWGSTGSSAGNNFAGLCPSSSWWVTSGDGRRGINGVMSSAGCIPSSCPGTDLTVLVEDHADDPWGFAAPYFIALRVDQTAASPRYYNFARVTGLAPGTLSMARMPDFHVTSSAMADSYVEVAFSLEDVGSGVHAVNGPSHTPLPASAVIKSYDLVYAVGPTDPGRDRSHWTVWEKFPYADGPIAGEAVLPPCWSNAWWAIGLTFDGGTGADVESGFVGRALQMPCPIWMAQEPVGAVPDGRDIPGSPLILDQGIQDGQLVLTLEWGASCSEDDDSYAIYEGQLGQFDLSYPVTCNTGGGRTETFTPASGDTYYLVAPLRYDLFWDPVVTVAEGSYGFRGDGQPRPQTLWGCYPRIVHSCAVP